MCEVVHTRHDPIAAKNDPSRKKRTVHQVQFLLQFYRVIPLPDGANPDEARAEFVNGVLRISVPVAQGSSNVRQIPIQTSSSTQPSTGKAADQPAAKSGSSTSSESQATQKAA